MNDETTWLLNTAKTVSTARRGLLTTKAAKEVVEGMEAEQASERRGLAAYLDCMKERKEACCIGNFELWSWERLASREDSLHEYGAENSLVIIADWMLDSNFCAVDGASGCMVFLGGITPVRSGLRLEDFLRMVAADPGTPHGMTGSGS